MTSLSESLSNNNHATKTISYPSNHWALQPCTWADPKMIAITYFERSNYVIYLNPTDKRGYRSIVRLINNDCMLSTINREYTSSERIGLALTMALVTEAYTHIAPIAQNAVAGNNAQAFDPETGTVQLGMHEEPVFLHGHVFGRGNPQEKYIEDVPLDGPIPGLMFDMRAQSSQELGNDKKVSWQPNDMNKVVHRLKIEIENICEAYKAHGLIVITRNISYDIYVVRHGETDWNIQRKLQGHTDVPLNANGKQQAQQLQEKFAGIDFTKIFSSDMIRARTTAEIIFDSNKTINIIETPLLREKSMGIWEGRLITELRTHLKQNFDLDHLTQEEYLSFKWEKNVESYADVYQRIQTLIRSIVVSSSASDGPILFCTHGGVFRAILYHLNFHPEHHWQVSNGALLKLRVQTDGQIDIMASEGVKLVKATESTCSF